MTEPQALRLLHRLSFPLLFIVPVLLAAGFIHFNLDPMSELSNNLAGDNQCSEKIAPKWQPIFVCAMTKFFTITLTPPCGFAFHAVFLSFVAAVITVTRLDELRLSNLGRSNIITRNPQVSWLLSHVASGAVVLPLLLFPAHAAPARGFTAASNTIHHRLPNRAELLAIPVAVGLGFIVPSLALQVWPENSVVVLFWLFFPVLVSGIYPLARDTLKTRFSQPENRSASEQEVTASDLLALYGLPSSVSVLSHWLFLFVTYREKHYPYELHEAAKVSLGILRADFWVMASTMLYWLAVEAGMSTTLWTLIGSVVGGPGAGLCLGWIMRDYGLAQEAVSKAVAAR
ncbi:hypothetical protein QBC35DRAFT_393816 [Podospora australis]|uniref:Uncharacterized protein n=1 Tax=Podospora australis TaxID=1536484 RepID=A0AAN6WK94_9PEZI|nr:hypothetical protein QBC35DRAFT_393816 [Podospora australis]